MRRHLPWAFIFWVLVLAVIAATEPAWPAWSAETQCTILISGALDSYELGRLLRDVAQCPSGFSILDIYISSPGGSLIGAYGIVSVLHDLQRRGLSITTRNADFVGSAAIPVYLTGDTRIAYPHSLFFLHQPEGSRDLPWVKTWYWNYVFHRAPALKTLPRPYRERIFTADGWYFFAPTAQDYGLVTQILPWPK